MASQAFSYWRSYLRIDLHGCSVREAHTIISQRLEEAYKYKSVTPTIHRRTRHAVGMNIGRSLKPGTPLADAPLVDRLILGGSESRYPPKAASQRVRLNRTRLASD